MVEDLADKEQGLDTRDWSSCVTTHVLLGLGLQNDWLALVKYFLKSQGVSLCASLGEGSIVCCSS